MKSKLIARRKKAKILVSVQTLRQAAEAAKNLIPILQSVNDPRLQRMGEVSRWLSNVISNPAMQGNLDDQAYPQFAQTAQRYVAWVLQMSNAFQTNMEVTGMPPQAQTASVGSDPWVTDRGEEKDAKQPEEAEVPRLAAKKTAQPMPAAPAPAGAAPAAAPAAPGAAPAPQMPKVTQPGNGNVSADIKQMSSKSLADMISAIAKQADPNDKALMDFIEALSKELKGRPVEVEQQTGKAASGLELFDGLKLAESVGRTLAGNPGCDQCEMLSINGIPCHETGCPNQKKTWDPESESWVRFFECPECGDSVREGESCNCMEPENTPEMDTFSFGGLNIAASEAKVAVTPPGISEELMHDLKEQYPGEKDKAYATAWSIHNKKEGTLRENLAALHRDIDAYVLKQAAGSAESNFVEDKDTMDVKEGDKNVKEIAEAHKLEDEGPAKLDRPKTVEPIALNGSKQAMWKSKLQEVYSNFEEFQSYSEMYGLAERLGFQSAEEAWQANPTVQGSVDPADYGVASDGGNPLQASVKVAADKEAMKASTALKKVETLADRLKEMYLDAKDITTVNNSRFVREAVEAIFRAYDLLGQAAKVLGRQRMQEEAEADALKVKEKSKKKGGLLDSLILAAGEEDPRCEGCGAPHNNRHGGYASEFCKQCEKKQKREHKDKPHGKDW
jgi:hypothetical protein